MTVWRWRVLGPGATRGVKLTELPGGPPVSSAAIAFWFLVLQPEDSDASPTSAQSPRAAPSPEGETEAAGRRQRACRLRRVSPESSTSNRFTSNPFSQKFLHNSASHPTFAHRSGKDSGMWAPDKLIVLRDAPVILLRKLTYRFRGIISQTEGCPAGDTHPLHVTE